MQSENFRALCQKQILRSVRINSKLSNACPSLLWNTKRAKNIHVVRRLHDRTFSLARARGIVFRFARFFVEPSESVRVQTYNFDFRKIIGDHCRSCPTPSTATIRQMHADHFLCNPLGTKSFNAPRPRLTHTVLSKSGCQLRLKNQWSPFRVLNMLKLKEKTNWKWVKQQCDLQHVNRRRRIQFCCL